MPGDLGEPVHAHHRAVRQRQSSRSGRVAAILSRANQALATLERYKSRLDEVAGTLSALEIEDLVTIRDAMVVVQRMEMVRRIADEVEGYVIELGTDGRLLALQLDELMAGVDADRTLIVRDYLPPGPDRAGLSSALTALDALSAGELLDLTAVSRALGHIGGAELLDSSISPRGFRLLGRIPRLPGAVVDRIVGHFGSLQRLLGATVDDLQHVEGVGGARARGVREGLSRLANTRSSVLGAICLVGGNPCPSNGVDPDMRDFARIVAMETPT